VTDEEGKNDRQDAVRNERNYFKTASNQRRRLLWGILSRARLWNRNGGGAETGGAGLLDGVVQAADNEILIGELRTLQFVYACILLQADISKACAAQCSGHEKSRLIQPGFKDNYYICKKIPTSITTMQENDGKYIFGVVKIGDKGQIVIPIDARKLYDLKPGDALLVLGDQRGIALLKTEIFQQAIDQAMEGLPR
jgi:AbrB family looped-hinge helix DNA binding protein